MSSQFTRTLVAMAASLLMSTVAVGAAIGPLQTISPQSLLTPVGTSFNA